MARKTVRYQELTRTEIGAVAPRTTVVLTVAAIEQHGPHLPVWVDTLMADHLSVAAAERASTKVPVLTCPVVSFGASHHHLIYPDALSLSTDTLLRVLYDLTDSLVNSGFRRIFILNAHGGNEEVVRLAARELALRHLAQENGKERCVGAVRELSQGFALAVPHAEALRIRDDVAFFQAVQAVLAKRAPADARPEEDIEHAVRQIISRAVAPQGVMDIFAAAGLAKPDISILSEEFLAEVRGMHQRNLAVELLQKLLKGELSTRRRKNVVQARSFAEMLEQTIRRYQNRAIEAAQVIEELIQLAKDMRASNARGDALGMSEDELAFYDALETNDSAVKVLGDDTLRAIAQELVETVRNNVTIDWTLRENVRAYLRVLVKRILRKYGYPPDKQEKATQTVLEQAALLSGEWAVA